MLLYIFKIMFLHCINFIKMYVSVIICWICQKKKAFGLKLLLLFPAQFYQTAAFTHMDLNL